MTCEEREKVFDLYTRVTNTMWRLHRVAPGSAAYLRAYEAYDCAHTAFVAYLRRDMLADDRIPASPPAGETRAG